MNASDDDSAIRETPLERAWVYQGGFLWVEKIAVRLPNGEMALREITATRDSVAVLPVDAEGRVHLVRQWRIALDRALVEIPAGLIDPGEAPLAAARRECEEELGVLPGRLIPLTRFAHAEGFATGMMHVFLGLELTIHGRQNLDATEFIEPLRLDFAELKALVTAGEIVDSKTILATHLAETHLPAR